MGVRAPESFNRAYDEVSSGCWKCIFRQLCDWPEQQCGSLQPRCCGFPCHQFIRFRLGANVSKWTGACFGYNEFGYLTLHACLSKTLCGQLSASSSTVRIVCVCVWVGLMLNSPLARTRIYSRRQESQLVQMERSRPRFQAKGPSVCMCEAQRGQRHQCSFEL